MSLIIMPSAKWQPYADCGTQRTMKTTQDEGKQRNEQYFIANKKIPEMAFDSVG